MNHIIIRLSIASLFLGSCKPKEESGATAPSAPQQPATETAAQTAVPYPLDTCIVSGEKLGSMGTPPVLVHEGREIKFCCKSCIPDFKEDPAKFLAKLK